jgi:hypothetical protein
MAQLSLKRIVLKNKEILALEGRKKVVTAMIAAKDSAWSDRYTDLLKPTKDAADAFILEENTRRAALVPVLPPLAMVVEPKTALEKAEKVMLGFSAVGSAEYQTAVRAQADAAIAKLAAAAAGKTTTTTTDAATSSNNWMIIVILVLLVAVAVAVVMRNKKQREAAANTGLGQTPEGVTTL